MKKSIKTISLFALMLMAANCGPIDRHGVQTNAEIEIVISTDSDGGLDPDTLQSMVYAVIDASEWDRVIADNQGNTLFLLLNRYSDRRVDTVQISHDNGVVIAVGYDPYYPLAAAASNFYPSCPDSSVETFWSTELTTINTVTSRIQMIHSRASSLGYDSKTAFGSGESLSNVNNYLSCSGLKVWGRTGFGYWGGLQLYGGQILSNFSMSLYGKGIYADSGLAFISLSQKAMNAGANWFIGHISSYWDSSGTIFYCWVDKALQGMHVCTALNICKQQHNNGYNMACTSVNGYI